MVNFTKKETSKKVSFAILNPNDIFYYGNRYWIKTYPIRDYDADTTYNAHTIDGDCEFDHFEDEADIVTTGDVEITTTF